MKKSTNESKRNAGYTEGNAGRVFKAGRFRAFLALLLCLMLILPPAALAESQQDIYINAQGYLISGQYERAIEAFESIRTYQDSNLYVMYSRAWLFGANGLYDFAVSSFTALGGFLDSADLAGYFRARQQEDGGNYGAARDYYKKNPAFMDCAERYLNMCDKLLEQSFAQAEAMIGVKGTQRVYDAFEAIADGVYSTSPARMHEDIYRLAEDCERKGLYANAYMLYTVLSERNYADSADKAVNALYMYALGLIDAGEYADALDILNGMTQSDNVKEAILRCYYQWAAALEGKQDVAGAYEKYGKAGTYSDSAQHIADIDALYASASQALKDGDADSALEGFTALHNFKDSAVMAKESRYQKALALRAAGDYDAAQKELKKISGYKDADALAKRMPYEKAVALFNAGDYDAALVLLKENTDVDDARDYINRVYVIKARALADGGNYAGALEMLSGTYGDEAESVRVECCEQLYRQAETADAEERYADSLALYGKIGAYKLSKAKEEAAVLAYGARLADEKRFDEAVRLYDSYGKRAEKLAALGAWAADDRENGRFAEAAEHYRLAGNAGAAEECDYLQAGQLVQAGEYAAAYQLLTGIKKNSLYKDYDKLVKTCEYQLAIVDYNSGKYADAAKTFGRLGYYEQAVYYLSLCNKALGDKARAAGDLNAAAEYYALAGEQELCEECYADMGMQEYISARSGAAVSLFAEAPHNEEARAALLEIGRDSYRLGFYDNAFAALVLLGDDAESRQLLTDCVIRMAEKDAYAARKAVADAKLSQSLTNELNGQIAPYFYALAEECEKKGSYEEAAKAFANAGNYTDAASRADDCLLKWGDALTAAGEYEKAVEAYGKATGHPGAASRITACYGTWGDALLSANKYDEAALAYGNAGNTEMQKQSLYMKGLALIGEGSYDAAEKVFDGLSGYLDADIIMSETYYNLGCAELAKKSPAVETARAWFDKAGQYLDAPEKINMYYEELLQSQLTAGKYTEAVDTLLLLGRRSDIYILADELQEKGLYMDALSVLKKLGTAPDIIERVYCLGDAAVRAMKYDQAAQIYAYVEPYKMTSAKGGFSDSEYGEQLYSEGRYQEAYEEFTKAGNTVRANDCLYRMAEAALAAKNFDRALQLYQQLGDTENYWRTVYLGALANMENGNYVKALELLGYLDAAAYPDAPELMLECRFCIAEGDYKAGNYEKAQQAFEALGDYRDAAERVLQCKRAIADREYSAGHLLTAAAIYAELGESALEEKCYGEYAHGLYMSGEFTAAVPYYGKALSLPDTVRDLKEIGEGYLLIRDYENAFTVCGMIPDQEGVPALLADVLIGIAVSGDPALSEERIGLVSGEYLPAVQEAVRKGYYLQGDAFMKDEHFASAGECFGKAAGYEDAGERQQEALYLEALYQLGREHYSEAYRLFVLLGEYEDCPEQVKETVYLMAGELVRNGKYEQAATLYTKIRDYRDVKQLLSDKNLASYAEKIPTYVHGEENPEPSVTEMQSLMDKYQAMLPTPRIDVYEGALSLLESGQYEEAAKVFASLADYGDAAEMYQECFYREAVAYRNSGDWVKAYLVFKKIPGYKDADALRAADEEAYNTSVLASFRTVGNTVTYGTYPQTKSGNDKTPIEWIVLEYDEENNRALLISKYGLECQKYDSSNKSDTWETCTLRTWLNDTFLNKAFSTAEQGAILTTNVDNSKSQCYSGWNTKGWKYTKDKIFLLSYAEANKYFNVTYNDINNIKSRVAPTAYAIAQGASTSSRNKTADGLVSGSWWLRSPGLHSSGSLQRNVARVSPDGSLYYNDANNRYLLVRPAFWLDLSGI